MEWFAQGNIKGKGWHQYYELRRFNRKIILSYNYKQMFTSTEEMSLSPLVSTGHPLKKNISICSNTMLKTVMSLRRVTFHCHKSYYLLFISPSNIFCIFACDFRCKVQHATGTMETISPAAFKNIVYLTVYHVVLNSHTQACY